MSHHVPPGVDPLDHQGLVWSIALQYRRRGLDLEDLFQEGFIGLMRACELYDPEAGVTFATYATYWIKNLIRIALRNKANAIRVPAYLHQAARDARKPDAPKLAPRKQANLDAARHVFALMTCNEDDLQGRTTLSDLVTVEAEAEAELDDDELAPAIAKLSVRETAVIRMRYGLDGGRRLTLREISEILGVSYETVRLAEVKSLRRLRARLESEEGS